jgi:hypothetical protein
MAQTAVAQVRELRRWTKTSYAVMARNLGAGESTLRRWRLRTDRHVPVLRAPGPKKVERPDMDALMLGMSVLHHGRQRTAGAPALWRRHQEGISRRDFYDVLTRYRARLWEEEQLGWWRHHWLKVGAVWSMDDMDFGYDEAGRLLRVHNVMDIGSRNMFKPMNGESLPSVKVADNLDGHFRKNGPPICVKSDWGSNLINSSPVAAVLSDWCVIPLLSPPRYPQYNGVMERGQSDIRRAVNDLLAPYEPCPRQHFHAYMEAGVARCNQISRAPLGGLTACQVFSTRNGEMKTDIHERRAIYEWIKRKQESILLSTADSGAWAVNAAWRSATEEWLLQNKVIEIIPKTDKVSTDFGDSERS